MSRLNSVSNAEKSDSTITARAACSKLRPKKTDTPTDTSSPLLPMNNHHTTTMSVMSIPPFLESRAAMS